ncbi:MAG TPA: hypothetical protein PLO67_10545 [Saprospiraceae bacterium]|jgi:hypothetical protein|nr:hypothetical protein [Saprospiraceae bacterium]HPI06286.1 hypothetical protein [Saprospiraceae bacterium]
MNTQNIMEVFHRSRRLIALTRDCILDRQYRKLRQCLLIAEKQLQEGNSQEKMVIQNDYMFSLSTLIDRLGQERKIVLGLLPPMLQRAYLSQINTSGV